MECRNKFAGVFGPNAAAASLLSIILRDGKVGLVIFVRLSRTFNILFPFVLAPAPFPFAFFFAPFSRAELGVVVTVAPTRYAPLILALDSPSLQETMRRTAFCFRADL